VQPHQKWTPNLPALAGNSTGEFLLARRQLIIGQFGESHNLAPKWI
jgi:hypothetical protein